MRSAVAEKCRAVPASPGDFTAVVGHFTMSAAEDASSRSHLLSACPERAPAHLAHLALLQGLIVFSGFFAASPTSDIGLHYRRKQDFLFLVAAMKRPAMLSFILAPSFPGSPVFADASSMPGIWSRL